MESAPSKRQQFTDGQRNTLNRAFEDGLINGKGRNKEKIGALAIELGISSKRIQSFIHTKTSMLKKKETDHQSARTGYHVYCSQYMIEHQNTNFYDNIKVVSEKWKNMTGEEKGEFQLKANHHNEMVRAGRANQSSAQQLIDIHLLNRKMNRSVKQYEEIGCTVFFCAYSKKTGDVFGGGCPIGGAYLPQVESNFACFSNPENPHSPKDSDLKKTLESKVREIYNYKYRNAGGKEMRMPYSKLDAGEKVVQVQGFPDGLVLSRLSSYTKGQLLKIIAVADQITFRVCKELNAPNTTPETTPTSSTGSTTAITNVVGEVPTEQNAYAPNTTPEITPTSSTGSTTAITNVVGATAITNVVGEVPTEQNAYAIEETRKRMWKDVGIDPRNKGEYQIEAVLKKEKRKNKIFCFVKWQGFSSFYNSWEPEKSIKKYSKK